MRVLLELTADGYCDSCDGTGLTKVQVAPDYYKQVICACVESDFIQRSDSQPPDAPYEPPAAPKREPEGLREWEVWQEGYASTGNSSGHVFLGRASAHTFANACLRVIKEPHPDLEQQYDARKNTVWGCRLFDNASDAARSFG